MGLFDFIGSIFKPAVDLVDELHVSDEERLKLRNEFAKIQSDVMNRMVDLEKASLEAQSKVQVAEANSKFAITATWRPIASLTITFIIIFSLFGWLPEVSHTNLPPQFWELAKWFLGGYTASRGAEKIATVLKLGK